jgi:hypothetical protein
MCIHKAYAWPEATAPYRIGVEGLAEDFDGVAKQPGLSPTAENNIRENQPVTPARLIERVTADVLRNIQSVLLQMLDQAESVARNRKSIEDPFVRSVVDQLRNQLMQQAFQSALGLRDDYSSMLLESGLGAASAGMAAGNFRVADLVRDMGVNPGAVGGRLSEILMGEGAGKIGVYRPSDRTASQIDALVQQVADAIFSDTETRLLSQLDHMGQSADMNMYDIRRWLQETYELSPSRAATIARTETARFFHLGQIDAWLETGAVEQKHFLMAFDACQFCQTAFFEFGEGIGRSIPIDEPFYEEGETIIGMAGGVMTVGIETYGTIHPNCRCDMMPVLDLDI